MGGEIEREIEVWERLGGEIERGDRGGGKDCGRGRQRGEIEVGRETRTRQKWGERAIKRK